MTGAGEILLVACYELGHQPLSLAWPAAFLERAGYRPAVMDLSVAPFDAEQVRRARLVAVAVPMHTALRLRGPPPPPAPAPHPPPPTRFFRPFPPPPPPPLRSRGDTPPRAPGAAVGAPPG